MSKQDKDYLLGILCGVLFGILLSLLFALFKSPCPPEEATYIPERADFVLYCQRVVPRGYYGDCGIVKQEAIDGRR